MTAPHKNYIILFRQLFIMFFLLTFLDDSGYLVRAAFITDFPMRKIGLSGKVFISLMMGFGCTVPAALSMRSLENKKDRVITLFQLPFFSCSAKIPVYLFFASVFLKDYMLPVLFFLYAFGILLAAASLNIIWCTIVSFLYPPFPFHVPPFKSTIKKSDWVSHRQISFSEQLVKSLLLFCFCGGDIFL